jgi:predicted DNA-binding transcriptional regulator
MKTLTPIRIATPDEVMREFKIEPKTKKEALNFLYRAGIVTKKGNLRKFYRNTNKSPKV